MDVYRTEEEQVAAIRNWWSENSKVIIAAVVLAIGSFAGWKYYQHVQLEEKIAAAGLYQGMMKSLQEITEGGPAAQDAVVRMKRAGDTLIADHGSSVYAQYAALLLAANSVEVDDYAAAEKYLRSALAIEGAEAMRVIAANRLAHVLSAQGKHDEALAQLAGEVPKALVSAREDARGDVLIAQGKRAEARAAWQKAMDASAEDDPARPLLTMKLDYVAGE